MGQIEVINLEENSFQKAYTNHLSEVSESRKVIASEDIYNAQGILLVRKGSVIDDNATNKIIQFKLLMPLEASVTVENTIDSRQLFNLILQEATTSEEHQLIHRTLNIEDELKKLCQICGSYPILIQKLTVLSVQLPKVFTAGLHCAYTGLAVSRKLNLDQDSRKAVFLAGLVHDIGMLHIDPKIVKKTGGYSTDEWRAMQAHTVIGQKVLTGVPNLPPLVAQAVLEHHERTDGAGYPKGAFRDKLSIEGQIVALSDAVFAIYSNKLSTRGRSFKDVIPIMQINSTVHFYPVYEAWIRLVRGANLPDRRSTDDADIPALINKLINNFYYFANIYKMVDPIFKTLPMQIHKHKQLTILSNMLERIYSIVSSSGILLKEHRNWLIQVRDERLKDEYIEIERTELIHDELHWQVQQLNRIMQLALTEHPTLEHEHQESIRYCLDSMEAIIKVEPPYK